jgi:MoaD family protein
MKVRIQYLGLVKTYTNKSSEDLVLVDGAKLEQALNKIASTYGKDFTKEIYEPGQKEVKTMFTVMVNGIVMGQLDGVNTQLKDGDNIILMPLMTGG